MTYTALKPCRFAGRDFRVGETVPGELVAPGAVKRLRSMGVLAAPTEEPAPRQAAAQKPARSGAKASDKGAGEGE